VKPTTFFCNVAAAAVASLGLWHGSAAAAVCGDGVLESPETCDDGDGSAGDGCSSSCVPRPGWTCVANPASQGTPTAPDSLCTSTCGDGVIAVGAETCDYGDALDGLGGADSRGCDATCKVKYGWTCAGPPGTVDHCVTTCGDGRRALGAEGCDDGNTEDLDGCSAACEREQGWICNNNPGSQGTPASPDTVCGYICGDGEAAVGVETCDTGDASALDGCDGNCEVERGWVCPPPGNVCEPAACGDGVRALGGEACDDGDGDDGDGCSADCTVEPGWSCVFTADDVAADSTCSAQCGDGQLAVGAEGCDDGGRADGDGCDAGCQVEPGWSCAGAPGALSVCTTSCGDGFIRSDEVCDDGNTEPLDGCAADCGAVEGGWACEGEPSVCATTCGDGLIGADVEVCDDGNTDDGDGCAFDCAEVELGWSCGDPPAEPSTCDPLCGDGRVRGVEGCDDGNNDDGDGCSADCRIEPGWRCDPPPADAPSSCDPDRDDDGVRDDGDHSGDPFDNPCAEGQTDGCDDNCPDYANPDQTFPTGEDATLLCPPYLGPVLYGGGTGCQGGDTPWPYLLAALALAWLLRRRRGAAAVFTLVAGVALQAPDAARAQSVDPRLFDTTLSPTSILSVDTSLPAEHLRAWGTVVLALANDELVSKIGPDTLAHGPLNQRFVATVGGGIGLFGAVDVALGLPLVVTELGTNAEGDGGGDLGDLRLSVRARLFGPDAGTDGLGLAVVVGATFPTGGDGAFASNGGATVTPRLALDYRTASGLVVAFNAGYLARPAADVADVTLDDEVRLGLGAEIPVGFYGVSVTGEVIASIGLGESRFDGGGVDGRETPAELLGGLRWRAPWGLTLSAAAGVGLTGGYGAPDYRALLSASYGGSPPPPIYEEPLVPAPERARPERSAAPPPTPATERFVPPAVFDRLAADDPDPDADGVSGTDDRCPGEPEDRDGFEDGDGCPAPDNDGDGVADALDRCPTEKEVVNGVDDQDGCPDEGESIVKQVGPEITIAETIQFKSGGAELTRRGEELLDQVAAVIRAHPERARIRIEGHTDSYGDREFNVDLAERRAWSVRAYLISRDVAATRLFAKGYGPTRPVASNRTEAGRAKNRRVEFHVIPPGEPVEGEVQ